EVARPLLVVVHADGQADRAVVVAREVGKAAAGVYPVSIVAQVVLPRRRAPLVRDGRGRAVLAAGPAGIAEGRDPRVDGRVQGERDRGDDAAHAEERPQLRVDDRAMAAELAEAGLEPDRNVQQIAVPDGMLDRARPAE